jgi:hypothetical protein
MFILFLGLGKVQLQLQLQHGFRTAVFCLGQQQVHLPHSTRIQNSCFLFRTAAGSTAALHVGLRTAIFCLGQRQVQLQHSTRASEQLFPV